MWSTSSREAVDYAFAQLTRGTTHGSLLCLLQLYSQLINQSKRIHIRHVLSPANQLRTTLLFNGCCPSSDGLSAKWITFAASVNMDEMSRWTTVRVGVDGFELMRWTAAVVSATAAVGGRRWWRLSLVHGRIACSTMLDGRPANRRRRQVIAGDCKETTGEFLQFIENYVLNCCVDCGTLPLVL